MIFAEEIADWHEFYTTVAGLAGTLIGLLFVGLALNPRLMAAGSPAGPRVLAAQTFHNFLVVLVVALVVLIPDTSADTLAITLLIVGVQGVVRVVHDLYRTRTDPDRQWRSLGALSRFGAPAIAYLIALWLGLDLWDGSSDDLGGMAAITFLLLLSAAINCWDLLAAIGQQRPPNER